MNFKNRCLTRASNNSQQIIENVGGRLLLKYDTPSSSSKEFWIFCTSEFLHPHGFASKNNTKWFLEPPSSIVESYPYEQWKDLLESQSKNQSSLDNLFNNIINRTKHKFELGMKLEALNPVNHQEIHPATVIKIFDDIYFLVRIDEKFQEENNTDLSDVTEKNTWLCTAETPYIFPTGWAERHGSK